MTSCLKKMRKFRRRILNTEVGLMDLNQKYQGLEMKRKLNKPNKN